MRNISTSKRARLVNPLDFLRRYEYTTWLKSGDFVYEETSLLEGPMVLYTVYVYITQTIAVSFATRGLAELQ